MENQDQQPTPTSQEQAEAKEEVYEKTHPNAQPKAYL
jgi:hypothetical protein